MQVVCNDLWLQLTHSYSHTGVLLALQSNPACLFLCMIFILKLRRGYKYPPLLSPHWLWFIDLIFKVLFVKLSLSNFCHWVTLTNIEIIISTQPLLVWAFHSSVHGHLTVEWPVCQHNPCSRYFVWLIGWLIVPVFLGLRGFLGLRTFSPDTRTVLGKLGQLIILMVNPGS